MHGGEPDAKVEVRVTSVSEYPLKYFDYRNERLTPSTICPFGLIGNGNVARLQLLKKDASSEFGRS